MARGPQASPTFGSERTGAPVVAFCRLDDRPIRIHEPIADGGAVDSGFGARTWCRAHLGGRGIEGHHPGRPAGQGDRMRHVLTDSLSSADLDA